MRQCFFPDSCTAPQAAQIGQVVKSRPAPSAFSSFLCLNPSVWAMNCNLFSLTHSSCCRVQDYLNGPKLEAHQLQFQSLSFLVLFIPGVSAEPIVLTLCPLQEDLEERGNALGLSAQPGAGWARGMPTTILLCIWLLSTVLPPPVPARSLLQ